MRAFLHVFYCVRAAFLTAAVLVLARNAVDSSAGASEPLAPGLHDVVVYDPGTHERGLPAVQFNPAGDALTVEIPPAVHVHRYYYSGDKEIQGPIISGGPTVVVANHPHTGQRMYIDVVLPSGAPRIAYDKHGITYVYPDQRVEVKFQCFPLDPDKVVIKHRQGQGLSRKIGESRDHLKNHFSQSAPMQSAKEVAGHADDFVNGLKVTVGDLTTVGADGIKSLANMVPGVNYLKSLGEQQPGREYGRSIRAAELRNERNEPQFVPTNR